MPKFHRLRHAGPFGSFVANVLTLLTTNWQVVVSLIAAIAAGAIGWLRSLISNPATIAGITAFLAVLWSIIGVTVLFDRRRPREVRTHLDYRHGITFEGIMLAYAPENMPISNVSGLHFSLSVRNFGPGPVRYEFRDIDIRLGTRALPKLSNGILHGYMARGAGRVSRIPGFSSQQIKEFLGSEAVKGTIEFAIIYGAPEGEPLRRLKMSIEIHLIISEDGKAFGHQENIISEIDEKITERISWTP